MAFLTSSFSRTQSPSPCASASSVRPVPGPFFGGGRNGLAVVMSIEIRGVGLFHLGDRVLKPVSGTFEGSLDFAERSASLEEQRRDENAVLGDRKQGAMSLQGLRPVGTKDARSNVDGIDGQFRLERVDGSSVVRQKAMRVHEQFIEERPRSESGWCLSEQLRANTKEMQTGVERVLVESGEPGMFSIGDEQCIPDGPPLLEGGRELTEALRQGFVAECAPPVSRLPAKVVVAFQ